MSKPTFNKERFADMKLAIARVQESQSLLEKNGAAMKQSVLQMQINELLTINHAKKQTEARPYFHSLIGEGVRSHQIAEADKPEILKLMEKKQKDYDSVIKATINGATDSTAVLARVHEEITGKPLVKAEPVVRPSDEELMVQMKKKIHLLTQQGKSLAEISSMCSYDEHTKSIFDKASLSMRTNSTAMNMSRDAIKEKTKTNWKGQIREASDREQPKRFNWDDKWVVAFFTNIETGERLKITGRVPYVQQYAVYDLDIGYIVDPKWGPQWQISNCTILPPYHDFAALNKFINKCVVRNMDPANKSGILAKQKQVTKAMTTNSLSEKPDWPVWLAKCEWSKEILECCKLSKSEEDFSFKLFPLIERAYNGRSFLNNNKWWAKLDDRIKTLWEKQFSTPETAFRMCFRQSMPEQLKFQCQSAFDELEDAPFEMSLEEEKELDAKKKKKRKQHPSSTSASYKNPVSNTAEVFRDPMCDLMLDLNHFEHLMGLERQAKLNKTDLKTFIPELGLVGFKAICRYHNWVDAQFTTTEELDKSREYKEGKRYVPPRYIAELKDYYNAIITYNYVKDKLDDEDCKECAFMTNCIPEKLRSGVDTLVRLQVFDRYEFACKDTHHNNYHEFCNGEEKHQFIFHHLWAECKKALVRRFKRFALKRCPDNTLKEIPGKDWIKFNEKQKSFVETVQKNVVTILTGGPGTGK
jgi:hypothetical protein